MKDDPTTIVVSVAIGVIIGCLVSTAIARSVDQASLDECREKHNVYACELAPVKQPDWVKPNAENT